MVSQGRPERQSDYSRMPSHRPLVIDNGAYFCRVGWAGEKDPRFSFHNVLHRPRHRGSGELTSIVGDYDSGTVKLFDFTRSSLRSAFDGNVVYQFETMESILDHTFDRIGVDGAVVDHPVLLTEAPCNPIFSRTRMAELLFETYGVPSLEFGSDGMFSYAYNQRLGLCESDGLLVCSGHTTTHVIPMVNGEPIMEACCRTGVGGFHVTSYLKRLLSLQHPYHLNEIVWEKVEELKQEYCYVAEDYHAELSIFQKGGAEAEAKTKWWQLPWVPPPEKEQPSEEELARRAAIKEKQGQRLREMAFAKRSSKIADLETEIEGLEYLLQELDDAEDAKAEASLLGPSSFGSREEVQAALAKATMSLRKAKGEPVDIKKVEDDIPMSEKYPLLEVPNSLLTPEQLKEKKKQQFLKITTEGRIRAKQKRQEEDLQREREQQLEEERRLANPELYLEELRVRQAEVSARVDQSKRQKIGMASAGAVTSLTSGVSGRGERLSAVQKERMKLLTTAAFDRGKDEDTFGMNDEDWELYKRVGKDTDGNDEDDEDEAELARINIRLKELDPSFMPSTGLIQGAQTVIPSVQQRPLTAEDFRIPLGVERFRAPEIVLQPSMMGLDQAGLGEMLALALMRLPQHYRERVMKGSVLLTGGNSLFEGLDMRLLAELRMTRPLGATIKVVRAADPKLDAWRGASVFASSSSFQKSALSKADFEERGPDWLRHHHLKYSGGSLSNSFLTDNT